MVQAAVDYADGRPVTSAPPSLRVYQGTKSFPGLFSGVNLLDEDALLWAELEVYAAEEARAERDADARARRAQARQQSSRRGLLGRFRK